MHRIAKVTVLQNHLHRPRRLRLTRLAEQFHKIPGARTQQMQVFDLVSPINLVERKRLIRRQRDRRVRAEHFDLPNQLEADRLRAWRNLKLVRRFPVLEQLEVRNLGRGRDAVVIGRNDLQFELIEQLRTDRRPVQRELRSNHDRRLLATEQRLAIDEDASRQRERFALVLEVLEASIFVGWDSIPTLLPVLTTSGRVGNPTYEDDRLPARLMRERNRDLARLVGGVLVPAQQNLRVIDLLILLVEHREDLPGRSGANHEFQLSFANQRPAAAAIADEIDNVHARLLQFRELEATTDSVERGVVVSVRGLAVRDQSVEIHVGVHLAQLLRIEVPRVNLEHLHNQRANILDVQIERNRLIRREGRAVGRIEFNLDSLLELLEQFGR